MTTTRKRTCCKAWADFSKAVTPTRAEGWLHELAHSRVPFDVGFVSRLLGCSDAEANDAIRAAVDRKWLQPTAIATDKLHYMGALARKR